MAARLGYLRLAVGLGGMIGPICCDLTYQYTSFITTFGMCTVLLLASVALCQMFLPDELNGDSVATALSGRSSDNDSSVVEQDAEVPESATSDVNLLREEDIGVMILFSDNICLQGLYQYAIAIFAQTYVMGYLALVITKDLECSPTVTGVAMALCGLAYFVIIC